MQCIVPDAIDDDVGVDITGIATEVNPAEKPCDKKAIVGGWV